MQAFKKVLDFAAKDQVAPDSQRDWQQWAKSKKDQPAREEGATTDEKESLSGKRGRFDEAGGDDWVVLEDKDGKRYRFNKATGETSYEGLSDEDDETSEEDAPNVSVEAFSGDVVTPSEPPKRAPMPPQVWEKQTDSLTRKAKWYCAEVDLTLKQKPLEHPWRAVKMPDGNYYFWNTETDETKWA